METASVGPAQMRLGELLEVQWGDINWIGSFIALRRAGVRGQVTTPRNHQRRAWTCRASHVPS